MYTAHMTDAQESPGGPAYNTEELVDRLRAKRRSQELSLRDVADQTGVSVPTISRVLRGHVPERENLLRLARWVGLRIDPVTARHERNRRVHGPDVDTLQAVELHLRADRNLSGDDADALADLFKIAYDRLRIRSGDGS
jgi:transcriptional regulator with XRE-family HTH domain